jgi:hypothetical protein
VHLAQRCALPLRCNEKVVGRSQSCKAGADCFEEIVLISECLTDYRLHRNKNILSGDAVDQRSNQDRRVIRRENRAIWADER